MENRSEQFRTMPFRNRATQIKSAGMAVDQVLIWREPIKSHECPAFLAAFADRCAMPPAN
jgi:hypothetical protein